MTEMSNPPDRLGKYTVNLDELEERARHIRDVKPEKFSVRKLAQELKCSNHNSSVVYMRILRGEQ